MLGKPRSIEFNVIVLRAFPSSTDSVAKFALILSPLTIEPDMIIEIPIKMEPILPVTKYAYQFPKEILILKFRLLITLFLAENISSSPPLPNYLFG